MCLRSYSTDLYAEHITDKGKVYTLLNYIYLVMVGVFYNNKVDIIE